MIRPITLFPFPTANYEKIANMSNVKEIMSIELSMGQMIEDVKLSVDGKKPVKFYGRCGGNVMTAEDIVAEVLKEEK